MTLCIWLNHGRACRRIRPFYTGVVELVDTQDLGSCAFGREGSSPFSGTTSGSYDVASVSMGSSLLSSRISFQLLFS